ncbi:MAG: hypothetical protein QME96_09800 [Myxococcota bacterium]|nr:hypothetical protein [Myxococcota bacterium]MDI7268274.1 hypothetical protein [Myxococcota bacterium]
MHAGIAHSAAATTGAAPGTAGAATASPTAPSAAVAMAATDSGMRIVRNSPGTSLVDVDVDVDVDVVVADGAWPTDGPLTTAH